MRSFEKDGFFFFLIRYKRESQERIQAMAGCFGQQYEIRGSRSQYLYQYLKKYSDEKGYID
jgi:hypothetical protein